MNISESITYLRSVRTIYKTEEKYLYEILEDYQFAKTREEQEEIFQAFCSSVWANPNKRRVVTKAIRFRVKKDLLSTELGQIFDAWSEIPYTSYRSMTKETDYASLIRQKVNNLYTNLFDGQICLKKEYMDSIRFPKTLYFQWVKGETLEADDVTAAIDDAIASSLKIKEASAKQKMHLSWKDYKEVTEHYFRKLFDHYINIDDYEDKSMLHVEAALWAEDNYCIRYFCKGLEGYFKNYQKEYYGLPKATRYCYSRCKSCSNLFEKKHNRQVYCPTCSEIQRKDRYKKYNKKRRPQLENPDISYCYNKN